MRASNALLVSELIFPSSYQFETDMKDLWAQLNQSREVESLPSSDGVRALILARHFEMIRREFVLCLSIAYSPHNGLIVSVFLDE